MVIFVKEPLKIELSTDAVIKQEILLIRGYMIMLGSVTFSVAVVKTNGVIGRLLRLGARRILQSSETAQ